MITSTVLECKKICLRRCINAVVLCVCMQFVLLTIFLLFVNFNILHPLQWLSDTTGLMLSFSTWLSIVPLIAAVVIYGILLGSTSLAVKRYYSSRFRWLLGNIVKRSLFLLSHILVGYLTAWLYCRFMHLDFRQLIYECYGTQCINSRYIFLVCGGMAASFYHFIKENLCREKCMEFPIVQEKSLVRLRTLLYTTLYDSLLSSFMPTLGFTLLYWLLGNALNTRMAHFLDVDLDDGLLSLFAIASNLSLILYAWILSSQILSNMQLMQRLFSDFLTGEIQFSIEKNPMSGCIEVTLTEALSVSQVPVIQNLAAHYLYNLSSMSKMIKKRQEIFSLSLPGGHPLNWNQLSGQCLSLINAFTDELASSYTNISNVKSAPLFGPITDIKNPNETAERILIRQYNQTFGVRRLNMETTTIVTNCPETALSKAKTLNINACQRINEQFEQLSKNVEESIRTALRTIPGLLYMFGEADGAKTAFLLSNCGHLTWLVQGLSTICAVSIEEDKYGVVQAALPEIIKTLLRLKLELDKLNNINLNGKKWKPNFVCLKNSVKRSLCKICTVFGEYMKDMLEDDHENLKHLYNFMSYQES